MNTPEFDEENLTKQNLVDLLNVRDLCTLMIQTRGYLKESLDGNPFGAYDYNSVTREMGFLKDIQVIISKNILHRLETGINLYPFDDAEDRAKISDLNLDNYFSTRFFNKDDVQNRKYEIVEIAKQLFPDFSNCIAEDWKFL